MINWLVFCWSIIVGLAVILVWKAPESKKRVNDEDQHLINIELNKV